MKTHGGSRKEIPIESFQEAPDLTDGLVIFGETKKPLGFCSCLGYYGIMEYDIYIYGLIWVKSWIIYIHYPCLRGGIIWRFWEIASFTKQYGSISEVSLKLPAVTMLMKENADLNAVTVVSTTTSIICFFCRICMNLYGWIAIPGFKKKRGDEWMMFGV